MLNVNVRRQTRNGVFSFDGDYLYYFDRNPHFYDNDYYYADEDTQLDENIRILKTTPIDMIVLKSDYEFVSGKLRYETGVKATVSRLTNDVVVENRDGEGDWTEDSFLTQHYNLKDDVYAGYVNIQTDLSTSVKLQAGLRTELTDMEIRSPGGENVFDLNFWSLFPTAFVSKQLNRESSLQFSYGRRITRPSYEDIAPFVVFIDPDTYMSGNPELKPTLTNNFQVNYLMKGFLFSVKYSLDNNSIANFQSRVDPETKKTLLYSQNLEHVRTLNLNFNLPFTITKWWMFNGNLNLNHQVIDTDYDGTHINLERIIAQFNGSNTFTISKRLSAEISGFFTSPGLFGIYQFESMGSLNAGFKCEFGKNRGTLSFNMQDILRTNIVRFDVTNESLNLDQQGMLNFDTRVVRLTYTKMFGRATVKSAKRSTASEAERARVKN